MVEKREEYRQDVKDIKKMLRVQKSGSTRVVAVAVHKKEHLNDLQIVSAHDTTAISNEIYDLSRDEYHIYCYSSIDLGVIDVGYSISYKDGRFWETKIALPKEVVERYLSADQKKSYDDWIKSLESIDLKFEFLQMEAL